MRFECAQVSGLGPTGLYNRPEALDAAREYANDLVAWGVILAPATVTVRVLDTLDSRPEHEITVTV